MRNSVEALAPRRGNLWLAVTTPSPDLVRIEIADDGPGLDPSLAARLFEPFVSTKQTGTGLGLYVCRLLTSRAGGTIEAVPREGGGTRLRSTCRRRPELPLRQSDFEHQRGDLVGGLRPDPVADVEGTLDRAFEPRREAPPLPGP